MTMRIPIGAIAALAVLGLTTGADAQILGPGMPMPGAAPPPQQQVPPCFKDFAPLRAEAEKRANLLKAGMEKRPTREEACALFKQFSAAELKMVKFIQENAHWCGIPPEAATQLKANHSRTIKTQNQVCNGAVAGVPKPSGPGLSEALGTTRAPGGALDPLAPQSGTLNTLTGNVLAR
jgi:hypothetical protein